MNTVPLHVLLVEDSPDDRFFIRRMLTHIDPGGYMVTEVDLGAAALAAYHETHPDCVLLDYCLPDMDGLEALAALRASSDVPVVLLTGMGSEPIAVAAFQGGVQGYLVKDRLTPERLHLTIQHAVATVQLTRERDQAMALLTTVLDTLPVGVGVFDTDLHMHQGNPALATMLGQPATPLPGQALSHLWPALAAALTTPCAQVMRGNRFSDLAIHLPAAAGHDTRWLLLSGTPVRGPDGGLLALITAQDITARQQAEADRRFSEARFRAIIEFGTEGLALLDPDGQIRYVSPTITSLLGYPPEEVIALGLHGLGHPDDHPLLVRFLATLSADVQATATATTRLRHHDGSWRWIALRGCNQTDFPALAALVVSFHDVTERVQATHAAQAAVARLQVLTDIAQVVATAGTDERAILDRVAYCIADALGGGCLIWLCADDAPLLHPVTIYNPNPIAHAAMQETIGQTPIAIDSSALPAEVVRSGQARLTPVSDPVDLQDGLDTEPWPAFERLQPQSHVMVPLRTHGQILGCLAVTRYGVGHPAFTEDDRALAQEVADRATVAIINVRLTQQAQAAQQAAAEARCGSTSSP